MTVQTLKIGGREFVLVAKRDFQKLAAKAREEALEDAYWTRAALKAEAEARSKGEKAIPFGDIERALDAKRLARRPRTQANRARQ